MLINKKINKLRVRVFFKNLWKINYWKLMVSKSEVNKNRIKIL